MIDLTWVCAFLPVSSVRINLSVIDKGIKESVSELCGKQKEVTSNT